MSGVVSGVSDQEQATLDDLLKDIQSLETVISSWDAKERSTAKALQCAINKLHKEAIGRLIKAVRAEPSAAMALRYAVADEVVYAVLRRLGLVKPSLQERLADALESVRPMLADHGGGVDLVSVKPPDTVEIRLLGTCDGCPASNLTLSEGIEKAIKQYCPEITAIKKARGLSQNGVGKDSAEAVHFFSSPFVHQKDTGWRYIAELGEIPERDITTRDLDGRSLILSRFGDRVSCFENACAHLGMPLDTGEVKDGILICPYHAFEYSLDTGKCRTMPEIGLLAHVARVAGGKVEVKLP